MKRRYQPVLLSIIMGNVRSFPKKMDERAVLTRHHSKYRECIIMVFTETWLTMLTTHTNAAMDGFKMVQADRTVETGKKKGEGLVLINDRCCNSGHITHQYTLMLLTCYLFLFTTGYVRDSPFFSVFPHKDAVCHCLHHSISQVFYSS